MGREDEGSDLWEWETPRGLFLSFAFAVRFRSPPRLRHGSPEGLRGDEGLIGTAQKLVDAWDVDPDNYSQSEEGLSALKAALEKFKDQEGTFKPVDTHHWGFRTAFHTCAWSLQESGSASASVRSDASSPRMRDP